MIKPHFCPQCGCAPFASDPESTSGKCSCGNACCPEEIGLNAIARESVNGRGFLGS